MPSANITISSARNMKVCASEIRRTAFAPIVSDPPAEALLGRRARKFRSSRDDRASSRAQDRCDHRGEAVMSLVASENSRRLVRCRCVSWLTKDRRCSLTDRHGSRAFGTQKPSGSETLDGSHVEKLVEVARE